MDAVREQGASYTIGGHYASGTPQQRGTGGGAPGVYIHVGSKGKRLFWWILVFRTQHRPVFLAPRVRQVHTWYVVTLLLLHACALRSKHEHDIMRNVPGMFRAQDDTWYVITGRDDPLCTAVLHYTMPTSHLLF